MTESPIPDDVAIRVEALPASTGDCLLVSCVAPGGVWRLLVDTGPGDDSGAGNTWPALHTRLSAIPMDGNRHRHVDLLMVTHIDHDHIGACRHLFADPTLGLTFGDVWFNGRRHLDSSGERGVCEAKALTKILAGALPWNLAVDQAAVAITPEDPGFREIQLPAGPRITLLSPTTQRLARLARTWDLECEKLRVNEPNSPDEEERGSLFPDLEALASHECAQNYTAANGSSIAMLLEHHGASVLLAGDAFANDLARSLLAVATHRGVPLPMPLDAVKLSHHGSRASLTTNLFRTMTATHYVVSTDNHRYGHPHDEALARVVLYGGPSPDLCFNYATAQNLRWSDDQLQSKYGFTTRYPEEKAAGVTIDLPTRPGELR